MGQPHGEPGRMAAFVSTIVFIPFLFAFVAFVVYFYSKLADQKYESTSIQIRKLEKMRDAIESEAVEVPKYDLLEAHVAQRTRQQRFASFPNQHSSGPIYQEEATKTCCTKQKRRSIDSSHAYYNPAYLSFE